MSLACLKISILKTSVPIFYLVEIIFSIARPDMNRQMIIVGHAWSDMIKPHLRKILMIHRTKRGPEDKLLKSVPFKAIPYQENKYASMFHQFTHENWFQVHQLLEFKGFN